MDEGSGNNIHDGELRLGKVSIPVGYDSNSNTGMWQARMADSGSSNIVRDSRVGELFYNRTSSFYVSSNIVVVVVFTPRMRRNGWWRRGSHVITAHTLLTFSAATDAPQTVDVGESEMALSFIW